jgi:hypothetical protein
MPSPPASTPTSRPRGPRSTVWKGLLAGLSLVVLLTVCGFSAYFIMEDERAGVAAVNDVLASPTVVPRDISSREVDPAPLTEAEVFPASEIAIVPGQPAYQVLKTQEIADCRAGATDDLRALLAEAGCSQLVRGTLKSPTGAYLVTGGIFNLATEENANKVYDGIKPLVDANKGRFTGLVAGKETQPIALAETHLGWDVRGHYLVYCVIARADGRKFDPGDPYARQIIYDMIVLHLKNNVLEKRAVMVVDPGASGAPDATASPGGEPSPSG